MNNQKHSNNDEHTNDNGFATLKLELGEEFALKNPATVAELSKHHLIYSILGLVLGFTCIVGGIILFLNGIAGSTNWTAKILGAESKINDAAPGTILFIVGLFIVFITKYKMKIKK